MAENETTSGGSGVLVWECGPHRNAWGGHDARCRQVRRVQVATDGPGWFWTQAEWAEWSNLLASLLPEEYEDDVAQEAIIERAVTDMTTQLADVRSILTEYEDAGPLPASYTNARALYERICLALGREALDTSAEIVDQNLRSMGSAGLDSGAGS